MDDSIIRELFQKEAGAIINKEGIAGKKAARRLLELCLDYFQTTSTKKKMRIIELIRKELPTRCGGCLVGLRLQKLSVDLWRQPAVKPSVQVEF